MLQAKYVHTNLIARDWRMLAKFYSEVFGCSLVPPERDYQGDELDAGTGLKGVRLTGVHLRLPGYDKNGPTGDVVLHDRPGRQHHRTTVMVEINQRSR